MMEMFTTPHWAPAMAGEIDKANGTVYLSALSMHPTRGQGASGHRSLILALQHAAKRGVLVRCWLAAPASHTPAAAMNLSARNELVSAGVEVRLVAGARLLHAKTLVIDSHQIWIGSGNFTPAACHFNHECYACIESPVEAMRWAKLLEGLA